MSKIKTIAMIGHFGGQENFTDGQTVKTKNLYKELSEQTDWEILIVDTYYKNKNPFSLILNMTAALIKTKKVIVLLSGNGMRFFFPILDFFVKIRKIQVFHDVIGGNLAQYVIQYPKYRTYLNNFKVNWVETEKLQAELMKQGIKNAEVLPNFRRVKLLEEREFEKIYKAPFRFCTFSRVTEAKGIEEAIHGIESVNAEMGSPISCLDIYGPVDPKYQDRFKRIMENSSSVIHYCGEVPFEQGLSVLKNYYAVLFPTHWDGEGQAGTIRESFMAGIPVIATDWHCNKEMITSGYNGILYPSDYAHDLVEGIKWLIAHSSNIHNIKRNCLKSAKRYLPDEPVKKVISTMEGC